MIIKYITQDYKTTRLNTMKFKFWNKKAREKIEQNSFWSTKVIKNYKTSNTFLINVSFSNENASEK